MTLNQFIKQLQKLSKAGNGRLEVHYMDGDPGILSNSNPEGGYEKCASVITITIEELNNGNEIVLIE